MLLLGESSPNPPKNQDLSWGNLSPKPPNEDDIPPRPEDGASCHGLVKGALIQDLDDLPPQPLKPRRIGVHTTFLQGLGAVPPIEASSSDEGQVSRSRR